MRSSTMDSSAPAGAFPAGTGVLPPVPLTHGDRGGSSRGHRRRLGKHGAAAPTEIQGWAPASLFLRFHQMIYTLSCGVGVSV